MKTSHWKRMKICFAITFSSVLVTGCWYAPWESQRYVLMDADQEIVGETASTCVSSVGGVQVLPIMQSSNSGLKSGEPPFILRISVFGAKGVHQQVKINRVKVMNEADSLLQDFEPTGSDNILLFEDDTVEKGRVWASTDFQSRVQVKDASNPSITVELTVQAQSNIVWCSETLSFKFVLQQRSGRFDWITK